MNFRRPNAFQTFPAGVQNFPGAIRRVHPRTRLIAGIVIVLLAAAAAWLLFFSGSGRKHHAQAVPVLYGTAGTKSMRAVLHTIGTVVSKDMVNVTARVEGQIVKIGFTEGQVVHQGDLLFQIDPRPYQAALEQAQGQLAKDEAQLVSARNDQKRYDALFAQNAVSQQQHDQADAAAKSAAATVVSDRAAVDNARLNLEYTRIVSPIDGKTGAILVQGGNMVSETGQAVPLVTVTQIHPVMISFSLPQNDLPRIQNQMQAGKLYAVVPMPGAPGGRETAKVDFVGNTVNQQTGTIELRATFPNTDNRLVPGQTVDVGATMEDLPNALVVPHDAVNTGPDGSYVYVIDADSKVDLVPVTVVYDAGNETAIKGNLKPGAKVVTVGQLRLTPGTAVTAKPGGHAAVEVPQGAQ